MGMGSTYKSSNMNTWLLLAGVAAIPAYYLYSRKHNRGFAKENETTSTATLNNNNPDVTAPGSTKSMKTLAGEATSSTIQSFDPTKGFNTSLTEILIPVGDEKKPIKGYRYIRYLNDDLAQSVIYDSDDKNAKLIGIEFHITDKLYDGLPSDEKRLWHSHAYEVKNGGIVAPRLPEAAEKEFMKQMAFTYGKAWSFWDTGKGDPLPVGLPKLLTSATRDGQLDSSLFAKDKIKSRSDLAYPKDFKA